MFATLLTPTRFLTVTVAVTVFGLLAGHPTLARSVGVDVWNVPELTAQLREAEGESERLDAEDDAIQHRIAIKETIIRELIAGRATLAEATAKFAEMNATRPGSMTMIRMSYPGTTDHEKTAYNVISYAVARVPHATRSALSHRLDTELQRMSATR